MWGTKNRAIAKKRQQLSVGFAEKVLCEDIKLHGKNRVILSHSLSTDLVFGTLHALEY
jgi:hypothetical protein